MRRDRLLAFAALLALSLPGGRAVGAETCRYSGDGAYSSHVEITSTVSAAGGILRIDVATVVEGEWLWTRFRFLGEEVTLWRGRELQSVSTNSRSIWGDHIVRQQWDDFRRTPSGFEARRVQAKHLADFSRDHAAFVRFWDPSTFGQNWLAAYDAASPERRPDLDLEAPVPAALRTPMAEAFYWVRYASAGGEQATLFLPGFKEDKVARLPIAATPAADGTQFRATILHPKLSGRHQSTVTAVTTRGRALLRLELAFHGPRGSIEGVVTSNGCTGESVLPPD